MKCLTCPRDDLAVCPGVGFQRLHHLAPAFAGCGAVSQEKTVASAAQPPEVLFEMTADYPATERGAFKHVQRPQPMSSAGYIRNFEYSASRIDRAGMHRDKIIDETMRAVAALPHRAVFGRAAGVHLHFHRLEERVESLKNANVPGIVRSRDRKSIRPSTSRCREVVASRRAVRTMRPFYPALCAACYQQCGCHICGFHVRSDGAHMVGMGTAHRDKGTAGIARSVPRSCHHPCLTLRNAATMAQAKRLN